MKAIFNLIFRFIILLTIGTIMVLVIITQPVSVDVDLDLESAQTNAQDLQKHVYYLSEEIFENTAKADILNKKADYIFQQFSQYDSHGHKISRQKYQVMGLDYQNIVMSFDGVDAGCGTYVIGAHYDTYGNLPGADDNTSGVAGLIELARLFSQFEPNCAIQLVAFTLEEPPYFRSEHMGSYVHAKSLNDNNTSVQMMISLEMIGYFDDEPNSQDYPFSGLQYLYSDKGNFISVVGNLRQAGIVRFLEKSMLQNIDLPVHSISIPSLIEGVDFSDHLNYWLFNFPAVMITDTAFFRNKNYHTTHDTAETLDYSRMAKVVDGVFHAVMEHMHQFSEVPLN